MPASIRIGRPSASISVLAIVAICRAAPAAEVPFGEVEIAYDETPIEMGGGRFVWKGKSVIPLVRDTASDTVRGSGTLAFTNTMAAGGCSSVGAGSRALTITGRSNLVRLELDVAAGAASVELTMTCPKFRKSAGKRVQQPDTDHVVLPLPSVQPVRRVASAGGPGILYTYRQSCEPVAGSDPVLAVSTDPAPGAWASSTPKRLGLTIDDIRQQPFAPKNTLAITRHDFAPKVAVADKSKPAAGSGVCYWVEKVDLAFGPIEVLVPTLTWGDGTCEAKAIAAHEEKHVADLKGLLRNFSADLVKAIQAGGLPTGARPRRYDSAAQGRAETLSRIDELVEPVRDKSQEARVRKAQAIDTPAEYNAVIGQCPRGFRQ